MRVGFSFVFLGCLFLLSSDVLAVTPGKYLFVIKNKKPFQHHVEVEKPFFLSIHNLNGSISLEASELGKIEIYANTLGLKSNQKARIYLTATESNELKITASLMEPISSTQGSSAFFIKKIFQNKNGTSLFNGDIPSKKINSPQINLVIKVPNKMLSHVQINCLGLGDIRVSELRKDEGVDQTRAFELRNQQGDILLTENAGVITAYTEFGKVVANRNVGEKITALSQNGLIFVYGQSDGRVVARTYNGSVYLNNPDAELEDAFSLNGKVYGQTRPSTK